MHSLNKLWLAVVISLGTRAIWSLLRRWWKLEFQQEMSNPYPVEPVDNVEITGAGEVRDA